MVVLGGRPLSHRGTAVPVVATTVILANIRQRMEKKIVVASLVEQASSGNSKGSAVALSQCKSTVSYGVCVAAHLKKVCSLITHNLIIVGRQMFKQRILVIMIRTRLFKQILLGSPVSIADRTKVEREREASTHHANDTST